MQLVADARTTDAEIHDPEPTLAMTDDSRATIDRLDLGTGWVCFEAGDPPPSSEVLPQLLHRTLSDWLARNSQFRVRATLPIVADGRTVAIHVWFD